MVLLLQQSDSCIVLRSRNEKWLVVTALILVGIKVVRNKKSKFFSHRYLIEFSETNRMSHMSRICTMSLTY